MSEREREREREREKAPDREVVEEDVASAGGIRRTQGVSVRVGVGTCVRPRGHALRQGLYTHFDSLVGCAVFLLCVCVDMRMCVYMRTCVFICVHVCLYAYERMLICICV